MKSTTVWKFTGEDANGNIATATFRTQAEAEHWADSVIAEGGTGDVWAQTLTRAGS